MSESVDKAVGLFKAGCNCSQSVVGAFCERFGVDEKTALRVACGLGAGLGRQREVCGAVSGMAVLAGLKYGNETPSDAAEGKRRTYAAVQQMSAAFREKNGSIICRELLGLERAEGDPTPSARTAEYYKKRPCAEYVADAAVIVEQTLF